MPSERAREAKRAREAERARDADARRAWDKMERCHICDRKMSEDEDYGGDCVFCMAEIAGEPAAIEHVERLVEKWKADNVQGAFGPEPPF